jgi:hypothetical protein
LIYCIHITTVFTDNEFQNSSNKEGSCTSRRRKRYSYDPDRKDLTTQTSVGEVISVLLIALAIA